MPLSRHDNNEQPGLAFHLGSDGFHSAPALALTSQKWLGGHLGFGPGKQPEGPTQCLTLCDMPGPVSSTNVGNGWWLGVQITRPPAYAPSNAGALLCNLMAIDTAFESEFNDWYDTEHLFRLSQLPGVIAARRFRATSGTPHYAAIYHLENLEIAQTDRWSDAARSPWTSRIMKLRHSNQRLAFFPAVV